MEAYIRDIKPAWKWILLFGVVMSFFEAFISKYLAVGMGVHLANIMILAVFLLHIAIVSLAVILHKKLELKGEMPFWVAFTIIFCIIELSSFLHNYAFNLLVYGHLYAPEDNLARHYYSNESEPNSFFFNKKLIEIGIITIISLGLARLLRTMPPKPIASVLDDLS